jgi:hypothetical protein
MQIKTHMMKWIASSVLVVTAAGVLSGCYVDARPRHHYVRPVVIYR